MLESDFNNYKKSINKVFDWNTVCKQNLTKKIKLWGNDGDIPLKYIKSQDNLLFLVLFNEKVVIYLMEDILNSKEKVVKYINLSINGQKDLNDCFIVKVKSREYLMISNTVNFFLKNIVITKDNFRLQIILQ